MRPVINTRAATLTPQMMGRRVELATPMISVVSTVASAVVSTVVSAVVSAAVSAVVSSGVSTVMSTVVFRNGPWKRSPGTVPEKGFWERFPGTVFRVT